MKEVKCKKLTLSRHLNQWTKPLGCYRMRVKTWVTVCGYRKTTSEAWRGFISNMVEIIRKSMSRLFIAELRLAILNHSKRMACLSTPSANRVKQNVFRLFVGYDGRLLVHQKRPEKRRDIEKNEGKKSKDQPIQTCQNILNCLQRAVETLILAMTFRDDETWDERHTWDFKLPWPSVKVWKIADLIIGAGKHPPGGTSWLPARRDYSFAKWPDFCQTIDLPALFAYSNFRNRTRHLSWSRRERVRIGSLLIILFLLTSNPIRQMIIEGNF